MKKRQLIFWLMLVSGLCHASIEGDRINQEEVSELYNYAYPLVLMEVTKQYMLRSGQTAINQFVHYRKPLDNSYNSVVTVNVDTLYSMAHLDLKGGPVQIEIPSTTGFYYMMPILDAWTNVIGEPGSRTSGTAPTNIFVTGPGWVGTVPDDSIHVTSTTDMTWVIARFRIDSTDDYRRIHTLQDQIGVTVSSNSENRAVENMPPIKDGIAPNQQVSDFTAPEFFLTFCALLNDNPGYAQDAPVLAKLERIGLAQHDCGAALELLTSEDFTQMYVQAREFVDSALERIFQAAGPGWRVTRNLGEYGTDYTRRALIAKIGLGANKPEDAIYPSIRTDSEQHPLDGSQSYTIHFPRGNLPPVKGFWSLTAYDETRSLLESQYGSSSVGSGYGGLTYGDDGSLTLYVQNTPPSDAQKLNNWIYVGKGRFNLVLRLYWPESRVLSGDWKLPEVRPAGHQM